MESDRINATSKGGSDGLQRMRPLHGRTTGPTRRSTKGQWTSDEDEVLHKAVQRFKGKNWKKIAECFKDRTDVQCLHRWQKVLNPELVKGPWSKEEDKIIIELVNKIGPKKWTTIAQHLPGRIGKQCRERWHNHLNPNINKEAWTQEEELILIRAHQVYGNKWAELTKFLPGRTDNAIKNHWNSSVKKKLDSYLASGLLAQIQGMPHISHINQSMPSSSSTVQQSSGDDSVPKDEGTETEAISECSQGSSAIGVLPANDIPIAITEERELTKASNHGKDPSFSAASCSERYNSKFEEVVPEVPCELRGSPDFLNHTYSIDGGNCAIKDWKINPNELPTISSLDMGQEFLLQCINVDVNQELLPFRLRTSVGFNVSPSTEKPGHMISEDDCHRVIYPEAEMDGRTLSGNFAKCPNISDFNGPSASLLYQPSNYQILDPPRTGMLENSCSQPFSVPSQLLPNDGALHFGNDSNQLNDISDRGQEMELTETQDDAIFYTNDYNYSPCDCGQYYMSMQDEPVQEKDSLKLVPVDIPNLRSSSNNRSFTLQDEPDHENDSLKLVPADVSSSMSPSNNQTCPSVDENLNVPADLTDTGSLFYEPPRFPSLDIPFFSCDLIQAGDDLQQEYSPLGIRQLMMSSVNCFSPFRLWDSPARDGSPDAVLKSAAKTFSCTPSILKKRNRDLVSPMSEKRSEKKLETDMNQELFSNLARDFSRLDVLFSKNGNQKAPLPSLSSHAKDENISHTHDKENMYFDPDVGQEEVTHSIVDKTDPENDINENNFQDVVKPGSAGVNAITKGDLDAMTKNVSQPSGVLVEHNMNDMLFFSPDRFGFKSNNITYANQCSKRLDCTSSQGSLPESSLGNPCLSVVISPMVSVKKEKRVLVGAVSAQSAPALHPFELTAGSSGNDAGAENLGIFGETPFKRNIESPSAWNSPWFINSFLPGPRVDTDITIEDIGYFMSPRDRSLDAIGLMKQLSEHNAAAFADAQEVLGHETPETILKGRRSKDLKSNQENSAPRNQPASHSLLASNFLTEKRVLDFSDCGTSEREKESSNISTSMSFSSPSTYLLKGCR